MSRSHEQELENYIRDGMARALWVHAFMIWSTEVDPAPVMYGSWDENAPDTAASRRASAEAADDLARMFQQANRLGAMPMASVFMASAEGRAFARSHERESTEGDYAYAFGEVLARICIGVMDPADSILPLRPGLIVPSFRVELDDSGHDLLWEGSVDNEPRPWERNPADGQAPEVLLIEDEPALQRSTTRMIKKIFPGAEVIVSDNADAAIANLQHHKFIHVVSDVDLIGDKSGVDVFRWVEQNQPDMVEHYTFFTGNDYAQTVHDYVVMKPAGLADLRRVVLRESGAAPVPAFVAGLGRPAARRTAPPRSEARAELTSQQVAQAVMEVVPRIRESTGPQGRAMGRYGRQKVFIAAIWRQLQNDPRFRGMSDEQFKQHLLVANRQGHLMLARADLVAAMERQEVAQSEIEDRGSTFNFVIDPTV